MADFFASSFWTGFLWPLIVMVAQSVLLLVVLLIAIAYILLADRKIWAAVQIRRGPNVVGPWGLLQSFADLLKFVLKEPVIPSGSNKGVFLLAPLVSCVLALAAKGGSVDKAAFKPAIEDFYLTNPIARASVVMAECSRLASGQMLTAAE